MFLCDPCVALVMDSGVLPHVVCMCSHCGTLRVFSSLLSVCVSRVPSARMGCARVPSGLGGKGPVGWGCVWEVRDQLVAEVQISEGEGGGAASKASGFLTALTVPVQSMLFL